MAVKRRKYSDEYIKFGFTVIISGSGEKPQCVLCSKVLSPDSMRPAKLQAHLTNVHPNDAAKPVVFFIRKQEQLLNLRLDSPGMFQLHNESEADYQRLIYYTGVRWLSRGNAFSRVFEFRLQVGEFLDSKNHRLAEPFMVCACVS